MGRTNHKEVKANSPEVKYMRDLDKIALKHYRKRYSDCCWRQRDAVDMIYNSNKMD